MRMYSYGPSTLTAVLYHSKSFLQATRGEVRIDSTVGLHSSVKTFSEATHEGPGVCHREAP